MTIARKPNRTLLDTPGLARAAMIFALCMVPALALFLKARQGSHDRFQEHFRSDVSIAMAFITGSLNVHLADIGSLGRFMEASDEVTRDDFETFIGPILAERGGLQVFEWVPLVWRGERAGFEAQAGREWQGSYRITERGADGSIQPARDRPAHYPVLFIEPGNGFGSAVGFDFASDPSRLEALEKARDSGRPMASERVQLIQDGNLHHGVLVAYPVYDRAAPMHTEQERRAAFLGAAIGVFRLDAMLGEALRSIRLQGLAIELVDLTGKGQVLYADAPAGLEEQLGLLGLLEDEEEATLSQNLEFASRTWQLRTWAGPAYFARNYSWTYWLILPLGAALSLLVALFVTSMLLNRERMERRSAELAQVNSLLQEEIQDRKKAWRDSDQVLQAVSSILVGVDGFGLVSKWNASAELAFAMQADEVIGLEFLELALPWDWPRVREAVDKCGQTLAPVQVNNLPYTRPNGKEGFLLAIINPIPAEGGGFGGLLIQGEDITDLKLLEAQLSHSQKLESIGQLAAGIAHEINTPIQYVGDSVNFLKEAYTDFQSTLGLYRELSEVITCAEPEAYRGKLEDIQATLEGIDYDFLLEEVPRSFARVQDGVERVSTIVGAMKRFSHFGSEEKKAVDLNKAIENTLIVTRNEWKYVAEAVTDLDPGLPPVVCLPGELNQVLLNVIVNASHAIGDVVRGTEAKGRISVATRLEGDHVEISVGDTGTGIPPAARDKVFDPFFTTKEVGQGSGQGLAISYDIVVKKHAGRIFFETQEGVGTTFFIHLPLAA